GYISLPLKVGNDLISLGYALANPSGGGEYPGQYKYIRFNNDNNSSDIESIYPTNSSLTDTDNWLRNISLGANEEIVGAFTPDVNKSCGSYIPRMFIGVADRNNDGRNEILIFSSEKSSCSYAVDVLENFGASTSNIIQGDGGGSAQLIVESNNNSQYKAEGSNQWITVSQGEILVKGRQWQGGNNGGRPVPHAFAVYSGGSNGGDDVSTLSSGVSKSDYVSEGSWDFYKINASSSHSQVKVEMTNLSNDVDLYVRQGAKPTKNSYICRPYSNGTTSETCTQNNSGSNFWYIGVQGYSSGSYTIKATLNGGNNGGGDSIITLTSGVSKSGSVSKDDWKYYKINASSSHSQIKVEMTNLSNDVDLYVRKGSKPSKTSYDCRPYKGMTKSETCTQINSGSNTWYIGVQGYQSGSYSIQALLSGGNDGNSSSPGDSCGTNKIYDCVMTCVNATTASNWTGDNYCDDGEYSYGGVYYNLLCPAFNNDGGDCN
ncbi:peptidase S8, partial [Candidatus Magnetomorum sp. HK-1]